MRKNSNKNRRINSEVQKELSGIIRQELHDPRIHPMTSVTEVEVTPDLKYCKVYISVLGSDEEAQETMKGLQAAAGFIRRRLAATVNLRNTPEIRFILSQNIAYGVDMSRKIDELIAEMEENRPEEEELEEDGEELTEDDGEDGDE